MGTNYYLHDHCPACGRTEITHICKSRISFQAKTEWVDGEPRLSLTSWAEWKERLAGAARADHQWVQDEYGVRLPIGRFIADVEATTGAARRRQSDYIRSEYPTDYSLDPAEGKSWHDPEGFSFSARDFS